MNQPATVTAAITEARDFLPIDIGDRRAVDNVVIRRNTRAKTFVTDRSNGDAFDGNKALLS
ncbi:hypothetical protein GGD50_003239 [Rhizobium paranaense]|uniref:Uncharacterized protein n=1 Tax=Rhizobium paranaense TaxID=1650438 RepID=A0A7W8XS73_9HYPH|nr:hypothetical protein [Rhizobium paranaense]